MASCQSSTPATAGVSSQSLVGVPVAIELPVLVIEMFWLVAEADMMARIADA